MGGGRPAPGARGRGGWLGVGEGRQARELRSSSALGSPALPGPSRRDVSRKNPADPPPSCAKYVGPSQCWAWGAHRALAAVVGGKAQVAACGASRRRPDLGRSTPPFSGGEFP